MTLVICPNLALDRVVTADELRLGTMHRTRCLGQQAGGKGPNVMRALAALGRPGLLIGFTGGRMGRLIEEFALAEGFALLALPLADESRVSTVVLEADGRRTDLFEEGPRIEASDEQALIAAVAHQRAQADEWAIVTGAAPAEASPAFYAGLAIAARGAGYRVMIDAVDEQLHSALAMHPDLVKVNAAEAAHEAQIADRARVMRTVTSANGSSEALADRARMFRSEIPELGPSAPSTPATSRAPQASATASCRRLVELGAAAAVVTRGAQGAVAITETGAFLDCSAPSVAVVNTVGSGDCFAAALAVELESGTTLAEALPLAAGVAAANAATLMMGHFDVATARSLATRVEVRRGTAPQSRPRNGNGSSA